MDTSATTPAKSLMYPLPAPHSVPKKAQIPWDPTHPYHGLGYRQAEARGRQAELALTEFPVVKANDSPAQEQLVKVTAKKFAYSPSVITLKRGVPAVLQLTSLDRQHGFNCPALKLQAEINPGKVTQVRSRSPRQSYSSPPPLAGAALLAAASNSLKDRANSNFFA